MSEEKRWPKWVYGSGEEPDYRFSFANERSYLAWIRTSLALLAAGVAVDVVNLKIPSGTQRGLATLLVLLGLLSALVSWIRWALAERAMRHQGPLPAFGLGALFTVCVVVSALVLLTEAL
jgi:putative membrane protein